MLTVEKGGKHFIRRKGKTYVETMHHSYSSEYFIFYFYFLKDFLYLILDRGEGREKERERNINVWLALMHPLLGPGLQPRHVP